MKTEQKQLLFVLEKALVCVIFASLYTMGGSGDFGGYKWLRRFLAPGLYCLWAFLRSFDWRYLASMPLMMGALTLPYGAEETGLKIWLRGVFGSANATATSIPQLLHKQFILPLMHLIIVMTASIGGGVFNQFPNAMVEQFIIGLAIILIPAMAVKRSS